jgi:hypothetical protein
VHPLLESQGTDLGNLPTPTASVAVAFTVYVPARSTTVDGMIARYRVFDPDVPDTLVAARPVAPVTGAPVESSTSTITVALSKYWPVTSSRSSEIVITFVTPPAPSRLAMKSYAG